MFIYTKCLVVEEKIDHFTIVWMRMDPSGKLLASWGEPDKVPGGLHGCTIDKDNNMWVTGNNDGIIQKYDPSGKLLIQVGTRGKFDSADGTNKTKGNNTAKEQFYNPAGIQVDPGNGASRHTKAA